MPCELTYEKYFSKSGKILNWILIFFTCSQNFSMENIFVYPIPIIYNLKCRGSIQNPEVMLTFMMWKLLLQLLFLLFLPTRLFFPNKAKGKAVQFHPNNTLPKSKFIYLFCMNVFSKFCQKFNISIGIEYQNILCNL